MDIILEQEIKALAAREDENNKKNSKEMEKCKK